MKLLTNGTAALGTRRQVLDDRGIAVTRDEALAFLRKQEEQSVSWILILLRAAISELQTHNEDYDQDLGGVCGRCMDPWPCLSATRWIAAADQMNGDR